MKKQFIPIILLIIIIAMFAACKSTGDSESTTNEAPEAGVTLPAGDEQASRSLSSEERMSVIIDSYENGEEYSVLDIEVPFWYPKTLDEALSYAVDMDYERIDSQVEDNTQIDSFWKAGKTDYPIGQAAYDSKGRLAQTTKNNLDGTYNMIFFLYETDDGAEADEEMFINVIDENADTDGDGALVTMSYDFQFYPNDTIYSATVRYYDENSNVTDFQTYSFDPYGAVVYYIDNSIYQLLAQQQLQQNLGGIIGELASNIDIGSLLEGVAIE